jgi:CubicO group peptidase (beta-lactamase class C family)
MCVTEVEGAAMTVEGTCASQFAEVRTEFERNFAERGEVGASVHVTVDGESVVDLWGGSTGEQPWTEDTLIHVWSCTKGATALCAHILASRGDLDLNAPVTKYWPEFGKNGKESVLVRHLLNHQAGLPAIREPLPPGSFYDWEYMTDALAREEPFWTPGTRHGYHGLTFGFLVGEVVRRVSGRPLGEFFRDEVAVPLGIEFWLGLPEEMEPRVAPTIPVDPTQPGVELSTMFLTAFGDPTSTQALQVINSAGYMMPGEADTRAARAAVMGAVGGITNARGLAQMYRPLALGGAYEGVRLVDEAQIVAMGAVSSAADIDAVVLVGSRFGLGFVKSTDNRRFALPADREGILWSEEAFGHTGFGGSAGFVDPKARLSFGYTMNRMGSGLGLNERGQSLIDATYRSLGYRQASNGTWF